METEEPIHSCTVNCLDHIPGSREFVNFQQKKMKKVLNFGFLNRVYLNAIEC